MKTKLITIVALIAVGIVVLGMTIGHYASIENTYNTNLAAARTNAERLIPYNAYNYYRAAFAIRCEDEAIYKEYLAQAKLLGDSFYKSAVIEYAERFPNSVEAYDLLCGLYYESESYTNVIDVALRAREAGAASEKVKNWYLECAYMLRNVRSGFEEAYSFLGAYALVKVKGQYGYLKLNGDYLLAPVYQQASPLLDSGMGVHDGEEWHIVNLAGYKVARPSVPVDYIGISVGGLIPVSVNGKYGYTNNQLVIPESLPYEYASNFKSGIAAVKKGGKWGLVNAEGENVTKFVYDDILLDEFDTCINGGVIFAKEGGKYYMLNAEGSKITKQGFDDARPFAGSEPAAVCLKGQWGFVNTEGEMVIKPQYSDAKSFSIGLAPVCIDGLWGYISTGNEIRVACQFEDCKPFTSNGVAAVKENDLWRYVQLLVYQK